MPNNGSTARTKKKSHMLFSYMWKCGNLDILLMADMNDKTILKKTQNRGLLLSGEDCTQGLHMFYSL